MTTKIDQAVIELGEAIMERKYFHDPHPCYVAEAERIVLCFKAGVNKALDLILEEARADKIAASNLSLWVEELIKRVMEK